MTRHIPHTPQAREHVLDRLVLIVDDSPTNCQFVAAYLRHAGFRKIHYVTSGAAALSFIENERPSLLLLDIMMPGIDGMEVCRRIRANDRLANLPVIFMTGLESADERLSVFDVGATDLVLKPIHPAELIARVTVHLERERMIQSLLDHKERTANELGAARAMQETLLPTPASIAEIERRYGISIAAYFAPSDEIGGDLWGVWPINEKTLGIFAFDFSGRGTIAAINAFRLHTILQQGSFERTNPGVFLTQVNRQICFLLNPGQFATMFYGVLDSETGELSYASSGYPAPFAVPSNGPVDAAGLPLGILPSARYPTLRTTLAPQDAVLIYSDAIVEAAVTDKELLGQDRARQVFADALHNGSPADVILDLSRRLTEAAKGGVRDDMPLIVLSRTPTKSGAPVAPTEVPS